MIGWLRRRLRSRPTEHRSYSSLVLAGLEAQSAGVGNATADWAKSTAAEIASGYWSRGLALARVEPDNRRTAALTPLILSQIGRRLARDGESLYRLHVSGGRLLLREVWQWDVTGGPDPDEWSYRLTEVGPSLTRSRIVPAGAVMHVRYAWSPATPWAGLAPGAAAAHGAGIAGGIDRQLAGESGGPSGYVMPTPDSGDPADDDDGEPTDPYAKTRADLAALGGGMTLAPTMVGGHDQGMAAAPRGDYETKRFGANPPQHLVALRRQALADMAHAYGLAPVLMDERASAAAFREAMRVYWSVAMPALGTLVAEQAGAALGVPDLKLTFPSPADVVNRSRAVQALTDAGMKLPEALATVGFFAAREDGA